MLKMRQENLISDISEHLENIYSTLNINFILGNEPISLEEVFQYWGLLGIFLYDKQNYIDQFCKQEFGKDTFAHIVFNWQNQKSNNDTLLNLKINATHNINDSTSYEQLVKFIITLVVTDSRLKNLKDNFVLDDYYESFYQAVNHSIKNNKSQH